MTIRQAVFCLVLVLIAAPAGAAAWDSLETGFKFATAIEADANDQALAQEGIVSDLIALGRLDEAGRSAETIKNWRKGTALADIGRAWAIKGDGDRARGYIDRADAVRRVTQDWGGPRIAAHMAQALALVGDFDRAAALVEDLAKSDPVQYAGQSAATLASGQERSGDFAGAMSRLHALDDAKDFEVTWWRTSGYLDLSRRADLPAAQRREALAAARRSADGVPGWKRGETLIEIGLEQARQGFPEDARRSFAAAETIIVPQPATLPAKTGLMADLAKAWTGAGQGVRARRLLKQAETEARSAAVIDRPAGLARIAGATWILGERSAARSLYDRALTEAGALVNARPRALAVVEICRSLGRDGVQVDPRTRARLDALLAGLGEPW